LKRVSVIRLTGRVSESSYRVQACQAWFSLPSMNAFAALVPLPCCELLLRFLFRANH
jgi:hypothetical protein